MVEESWTHADYGEIRFRWRPGLPVEEAKPANQSYGLCVNKDNKVCLIVAPTDNQPHLPGGTVEAGETILETLQRELWEEANIRVEDPVLLGFQEVTHLETPHPVHGETYYQARYAARISEISEVTEDPDKGYTHRRIFVPIQEVNTYLGWGDIGDELVEQTRRYAENRL